MNPVDADNPSVRILCMFRLRPIDASNRNAYRLPMKPGQILEVEILHLGSRGEGVARFEDHTIYFAKTAPGDLIEGVVETSIRGRWVGRVLKILKPSPKRIQPRCQHFSECGGCDFQHLSYEAQVEWKKSISQHWLKRSPIAPHFSADKIEVLVSPKDYNYRHRVRFDIENGTPAFHLPRSNRLLPLKECPVLESGLWTKTLERSSTLRSGREVSVSWTADEALSYSSNGRELKFNEKCFTQANLYQNENFIRIVIDEISKCDRKEIAFDLFSGIGNFSAALVSEFRKVYSVEAHPEAVTFGRSNIPEAVWLQKDVRQALETDLRDIHPDFVILDPARLGALSESRILATRPIDRVLYISCQLDSLIRDLTAFTKSGNYQIDRWVVADLLPQTRHIESIVTLKRKIG